MQVTGSRLHLLYDNGRMSGGNVYEQMVAETLASAYDVAWEPLPRGRQWLRVLAGGGSRASSTSGGQDYIASVSAFDGVFMPNQPACPRIIIVHHLDFSKNRLALPYKLAKPWILHKLRAATQVVAVSALWKERLEDHGVKNVRVIHNGFDLTALGISDADVRMVRERYGLQDKPIVHLGTSGPGKGVERAFDALRSLDAHFVCSGGTAPRVKGPQHLMLSYRDYLTLLTASTIVVTMSEFEEGWCRAAHEAMLCGTPVVGSGQGGMAELLNGGQQVICPSFSGLRAVVGDLLAAPDQLRKQGTDGRAFARGFDRDRFAGDWLTLTADVAAGGRN